jgi:hypothetical protein
MSLSDKLSEAIKHAAARHRAKHVKESKTPRAKKSIKHVGFSGAEKHVENEGYSKEVAAKIIGFRKAHASAAAKRANPHLLNTAHHKVK